MKRKKYQVWKAPGGESPPGVSVTPAPSGNRGSDSAHGITPGNDAATGNGALRKYRVWRPGAPADSTGQAPRAAHLPGCRFYPVACVPDLWVCERECIAPRTPVREGHPNYGGDGSTSSGEFGLELVELRDDYARRAG